MSKPTLAEQIEAVTDAADDYDSQAAYCTADETAQVYSTMATALRAAAETLRRLQPQPIATVTANLVWLVAAWV